MAFGRHSRYLDASWWRRCSPTSKNPMENICHAIMWGTCSSYDLELMFVSSDASANHRGGGGGGLVNAMCPDGLTPLCMACQWNRADLVPMLVHKGALVNVPSIYLSRSPLHYASDHSDGNLDMVNMLLAWGAQPNVQDEDGKTPLHLACINSNVPVVKALLEAGSEVDLKDHGDETPLVRACSAKSVELVDLLLKAGSDPNYPQGRPLEVVVRASSVESLKLLIGAGARLTTQNYLSFASEHNNLDMMKVLRNYGADVNATGLYGVTALHHACLSHEASCSAVRLLLSWGASPNLATNSGDTALHMACQGFQLDKVRLLLMYGANINQMDRTLASPLITALTVRRQPRCDASYLILIRLLLAAGARLTLPMLERFKPLFAYTSADTNESQFSSSSSSTKEELMQILTKHASQPQSLQDLCRVAVRKTMAGNVDQKVCDLPLPNSIVKFIQFSDIPECVYRQ